MLTTPNESHADVARRIGDLVAEIRADNRWRQETDRELDALFEQSARSALRARALLDRSVKLRRISRRVIPARLRPTVKYVAHRLGRAR